MSGEQAARSCLQLDGSCRLGCTNPLHAAIASSHTQEIGSFLGEYGRVLAEHLALHEEPLCTKLEVFAEALDEAGRLLDEDGARAVANLGHAPRVVEVAITNLRRRQRPGWGEHCIRAAQLLSHVRRDSFRGEKRSLLSAFEQHIQRDCKSPRSGDGSDSQHDHAGRSDDGSVDFLSALAAAALDELVCWGHPTAITCSDLVQTRRGLPRPPVQCAPAHPHHTI